ncbi:hypothetical protein MPTK1_4g19660 [Marchantia polymorpha subsp. ruderalis]
MTWRARHTGTIAAMNIQRARALALRSDPADPAGAWAVLQTSGRRKQNRPSNSCNPLSTSGIDILGLHFREVSKGRLGRLRRHRVQSCPVSSFADSILFIKLKRFLARTHTHFPLFVSHGKVDGCLPACLPACQPAMATSASIRAMSRACAAANFRERVTVRMRCRGEQRLPPGPGHRPASDLLYPGLFSEQAPPVLLCSRPTGGRRSSVRLNPAGLGWLSGAPPGV